jgi:hypothetical protein
MELLLQPVRIKKGYLLYTLLFIGYVSSADCVPETKLPLVNSLAELQAIRYMKMNIPKAPMAPDSITVFSVEN